MNRTMNSTMSGILNDELLPTLFRFVDPISQKIGSGFWGDCVVPALTDNQGRCKIKNGTTTVDGLDLSNLLYVLEKNWNSHHIKPTLRERFSQDVFGWVKEAQNVRNRWSHKSSKVPDPEDVEHDIGTVLRLMKVLGADEEALKRVGDAKRKVVAPTVAIAELVSASKTEQTNSVMKADDVSASEFEKMIGKWIRENNDPLAKSGNNIAIYRGNPRAKIVIVGEAPGKEENKLGKPFVGPAGVKLNEILGSVKFDVERDALIVNSVFRMPPGEGGVGFRVPSQAEIDGYRPYVMEILQMVKPKIVLLLGNVAVQSVLGKSGITRLRGQWIRWNECDVMPMFHPAYLLRNQSHAPGSPKALTWRDIQAVRDKYDQIVKQ